MNIPEPVIEPEKRELLAAPRIMHPASVNCHTCGTCVWAGGRVADDEDRSVVDLPFGEIEAPDGSVIDLGGAQDLLTLWADGNCAREDCPHTAAALEQVAVQDPAVLAAQVAELREALARITASQQ